MGRLLKYILLLAASILLAAGPAPAQTGELHHELTHKRFTTLDGISQMQTETIWQDGQG